MPLRALANMSLGKLLFAAGLVIVVLASLYADFRWRGWIAERKAARESADRRS